MNLDIENDTLMWFKCSVLHVDMLLQRCYVIGSWNMTRTRKNVSLYFQVAHYIGPLFLLAQILFKISNFEIGLLSIT